MHKDTIEMNVLLMSLARAGGLTFPVEVHPYERFTPSRKPRRNLKRWAGRVLGGLGRLLIRWSDKLSPEPKARLTECCG